MPKTTDFQLQEGQMFIFKNEKCDPAKKQPTHRGQLMFNGVEAWVSCWVKTGSKGKFFSCAIQEKEDQPDQKPHPTPDMNTGSIDDDIPF